MILHSIMTKFQSKKVYQDTYFNNSIDTLIPISDWNSMNEIEYEITEKQIGNTDYLKIKRQSQDISSNLKFKSKGYGYSYLTTESKQRLVSISENGTSTKKVLKWKIKLEEETQNEKLKFQNIALETRDGKEYLIAYNSGGDIKKLKLNINSNLTEWKLNSLDNENQTVLNFKFPVMNLRKRVQFKVEREHIGISELVLLLIITHLLSYKSNIEAFFNSSSIKLAF
ncbi:hypothetical protein K502DRAFT_178678 [Neoconidiobolus thromboides FSU 785]|nr:hypothetical protein K502DRAFT_178678 [Neoconidiobolus thromboides FSU 785]